MCFPNIGAEGSAAGSWMWRRILLQSQVERSPLLQVCMQVMARLRGCILKEDMSRTEAVFGTEAINWNHMRTAAMMMI